MPDGTATLYFVPWLRGGATTAIDTIDPLVGSIAANATIAPWVRIAGHTVAQSATLRGPGHVVGLAASSIVKREPPDATAEFESSYFPFVEVAPADLPWRFTPAASGKNAQLRPWLVLVVVRRQEGVRLAGEPGVPLPVLHIETPALPSRELPDLADSAAWAHVQSHIEPGDLGTAWRDDDTVATARLLCPRRLTGGERWLACLVPAFDVGVQAGLGGIAAGVAETGPAWDLADPSLDAAPLRLPVYASWTFDTAADGDFEALARRLESDNGEAVIGRAPLDVTDPGAPLPRSTMTRPVIGDFVGALTSVGVRRGTLPKDYTAWLEPALAPVLEASADRRLVPDTVPARYDPKRDDPVVAPPLYGAMQTSRTDVPPVDDPQCAWMRPLNLDPQLRAIAGLGARVVRAESEALVASAWTQAGAIRQTAAALSRTHLATETSRSLARRAARFDPGALVQASMPLHAWVTSPVSARTLATDLAHSAVPRGLVSAAFARATRKGTALGRTWRRHAPSPDASVVGRAATAVFLGATSPAAPDELRGALDFALTALPVGAWTRDPALEGDFGATFLAVPDTVRPATSLVRAATRFGTPRGPNGVALDSTIANARSIAGALHDAHRVRLAAISHVPLASRLALDLSGSVTAVISALDQRSTIESALTLRIAGLASLRDADGALPRSLTLAPIFGDPLSWDLIRIDPRFFAPGVDTLGDNRVALLEANDDFIAAFIAGANHEMARELLWREYPCALSATFFHRFWDTGDAGADDIGDIAGWKRPRLGGNVIGQSASALVVVMLRGDLLRQYPEAHIYLCRGVWQANTVVPDEGNVLEAVLQGAVDRQTVFYGFPVSAPAMRGDRASEMHTEKTAGWFVAIEELSLGPRFGLDAAADDGSDLRTGATSWNDLTWGHLVPRNGTLGDMTHAVARKALPSRTHMTLDGITWGYNSAHMAVITWQRPFRLFIHADRLLPP